MISPLDETCPPDTLVTNDSHNPATTSTEPEIVVEVADEGSILGAVVKPDSADEPCPGSRTGDGCE